MSLTLISYLMMGTIVFLLVREKVSLSPVFILIPIAAALLCGYSPAEISGFVSEGFLSLLNTALLFLFSIVYFSILQEVGLFEVMMGFIMKYMRNSVPLLFLITALVSMVIQLDGSGAMTMLITIPTLLPLYDAMGIRRTRLVLLVSASAGIMNFVPWCSAMLRLSASTGLDPVKLWHTLLPLQGIGFLLILLFCLLLARAEIRNGSRMTDAEFKILKENYSENISCRISPLLMIFDAGFTVLLIFLLLTEAVSSVFGFMIGLSVLLIVNFPDPKDQSAQIKKHAATAFPLVLVIFSLGCLVGIMNHTGMITAIADSLIALIPDAWGNQLPLLYGLIGLPVSVIVGSDCCYSILAPVLGTILESYGGTMLQSSAAILLASSFAANITFIGPAPYLSVSLAGITMKEHLRYSMKYLWLLCVLLSAAAALLHIF